MGAIRQMINKCFLSPFLPSKDLSADRLLRLARWLYSQQAKDVS